MGTKDGDAGRPPTVIATAAAGAPAANGAGTQERINHMPGAGTAQAEAVRSGLIAGAVMQDPIRVGYKAVEAAVSVLRGMKVPRKIDTGFHWYDRENIDDPAIAALLHP